MVSQDRWKSAQSYELGYWEAQGRRIADGTASQLDWYRWRADQLEKRLRNLGLDYLADGDARMVEVGSGPIGILTYFPAAERIAVDPLAEEYARSQTLCELRNPEVTYRKGVGEELPCPDEHYDMAAIENCIDHVQDADAVMRELVRVLRPGGILYLTVNNRTRVGYWVHRLLSRLRIDRGHPYTFTPRRTAKLLERHGFKIVELQKGSFLRAWREDILAEGARAKLKAILGISEYLVSVVAVRTGAHVPPTDGLQLTPPLEARAP